MEALKVDPPDPPASNGDDAQHDELARLDGRLAAFEAKTGAKRPMTIMGDAGAGYRLLARMLGVMLGGVGLGWEADRLFHVRPFGIVTGVLAGGGLALYSAITAAAQMGRPTTRADAPPAPRRNDGD